MDRYEEIKHNIEMLAAEEFQRGRMAIIKSLRLKLSCIAVESSTDRETVLNFLDYLESM